MHSHRSYRHVLLATAALSLSLPALARAQTVTTPPARVGQVADVNGSVSFNGAGSNGQWVAATPNYPVTVGDSLFTQNDAQAALDLGASRLTLGPNTELQVTALDDDDFAATATQGEVFLNLTDLQQGQNFTLTTPRGPVTINADGQYDIISGDANDPTEVAVLAGSASAGGTQIAAGQEAQLSGTDPVSVQLGALQRDQLMDQAMATLSPPPPPYAPPVVAQMTGAQQLSGYGTWDQDPSYGAVWYPNVDSGWAPYREGHWAFIAPWGWTWVEAEPWGFAPFHYGRWIDHGDRWGWVPAADYQPGAYERPVYAPALVGFFGLGVGVAITAQLLSSGSVGWVPLAPGEVYRPPYHVSNDYFRRINRVDVRNDTQININNTTIINNYANRRGATYIPAADMARGASVAHYGRPVPEAMLAHAAPMHGELNQALRPQIAARPAAAPRPDAFNSFHQAGMPITRPQGGPDTRAETRPMAPNERPAAVPNVYRPAEPQVYTSHAPETRAAPAAPTYRPAEVPNVYRPAAPAYAPHAPESHAAPAAPAYRPAPAAPNYRPAQLPNVYHPPAPPAYAPHAPAAVPSFHPAQLPNTYRPAQNFAPRPAQAPQTFHPEPEAPRPEAPRPVAGNDQRHQQ